MIRIENEYSLFKALCHQTKLKVPECSSKVIQKLLDKGMKIYRVNDHYELSQTMSYLERSEILKHLDQDIIQRISDIIIEYQVNSTNESIHDYEQNQDYLVMLAESQYAGKGRRVKQWHSPLGCNIYLSIKFIHPKSDYIHFVPLLTAVAVCKGLNRLGIAVSMIKWPNDVYVNAKKIAGILVENRYNSASGNTCVVGIGLNVNMKDATAIDQDWTSLALEKNEFFDRNYVTGLLLSEIISQYEKIPDFNAKKFIKQWQEYDYLKGKNIEVIEDNTGYEAKALGLSQDGSLKILLNGYIKNIYSADVSVDTRV